MKTAVPITFEAVDTAVVAAVRVDDLAFEGLLDCLAGLGREPFARGEDRPHGQQARL